MTDMRLWSHEFIAEFINLYKSFPCLYEIKSKDYLNKGMKLSAYNQFVEKLKTLDPTATKDTVVKKINNMRSSYRKELKKIRESRRTGSSGEIYASSLWYFHLLDFLYDQEVPRKSHSNMEEEESSQDDEVFQDLIFYICFL
nr:unnamed protein product [Callosobruchus chinensis]